jgi:hypothetical protein
MSDFIRIPKETFRRILYVATAVDSLSEKELTAMKTGFLALGETAIPSVSVEDHEALRDGGSGLKVKW